MKDGTVHRRVDDLTLRFRQIGDELRRELNLYNTALEVEAYGFDTLDELEFIGVLITPWFMNLVLLPVCYQTIEAQRYGETRRVALPGGETGFLYGGDPAIGALWACSLHSPMDVFRSPEQARAEARLRLGKALTPVEPEPANGLSRRGFLSRMRASETG